VELFHTLLKTGRFEEVARTTILETTSSLWDNANEIMDIVRDLKEIGVIIKAVNTVCASSSSVVETADTTLITK
jgi:hypothetical protein